MKVTLWGTRGSVASAGPDTVVYGGNTSCVEVRGADGTRLVLDAGTGIQRLGATIDGDATRVDVLLTHLHMDHIQGLGFFAPLFRPGLEVHLWGPPSAARDLRARLTRYLSPPLFPVPLRELPCRLRLHDVPMDESFDIGGLRLRAGLVCHPGPTVGYRITEGKTSLAYLPDHEPALGMSRPLEAPDWTSGFELAAGVGLLVHDAQYTEAEYRERVGWGHSAMSHVLDFASLARVQRLVTFHHDPTHDDQMLDGWLEEARRTRPLSFELLAGVEGRSFDLDVG